ncbi:MAG: hypothetical protein NT02SARS_0910 [SAR86 cluster bacterium SAR86B]|uniref:DUF3108 domain-containing protein n=1 Tax=SAR86 cluster bacterium SAR86B TaxID=1123867 RepID=J4WZ08_9GAMM|nr:MAG: hypothetical protein NT02SARS_0910 [SAR86 cluster bacterium SAR86B]
MYKLIPVLLLSLTINAEVKNYSAEYEFISEEITIAGTRALDINEGLGSLSFKAKNLLASMFFESKFRVIDGKVISDSYKVRIKPKFVNRDQEIVFNHENNTISSNGRDNWIVEVDKNIQILDPLNSQIQLKLNIANNVNNFSLNLIDLENGELESYQYIVDGVKTIEFKDELYDCMVVKRTKLNSDSNKVTLYFVSKDLGYMFIEVQESSEKREQQLQLIELLSLG